MPSWARPATLALLLILMLLVPPSQALHEPPAPEDIGVKTTWLRDWLHSNRSALATEFQTELHNHYDHINASEPSEAFNATASFVNWTTNRLDEIISSLDPTQTPVQLYENAIGLSNGAYQAPACTGSP